MYTDVRKVCVGLWRIKCIYNKWILGKCDGGMLSGFIWLRIGLLPGSCEHGNEPSDYIKRREFI
jgi:hypothetical protein